MISLGKIGCRKLVSDAWKNLALVSLLFGMEGSGMMLGAKMFFCGTGPTLPYDAEVEYVERVGSDVDNYAFSTGIFVDDNDYMIICDCMLIDISASWCCPYQAYINEPTECTRVMVYDKDVNSLYCGYRRTASSQTRFTVFGGWKTRHIYSLSYMKISVEQYDGAVTTYNLPVPSGLKDGGTEINMSSSLSQFRYFGFRVLHKGIYVMDLIPVRFTNDQGAREGAMYDRVSGKLFRNQGSGSFLIGPDKA